MSVCQLSSFQLNLVNLTIPIFQFLYYFPTVYLNFLYNFRCYVKFHQEIYDLFGNSHDEIL